MSNLLTNLIDKIDDITQTGNLRFQFFGNDIESFQMDHLLLNDFLTEDTLKYTDCQSADAILIVGNVSQKSLIKIKSFLSVNKCPIIFIPSEVNITNYNGVNIRDELDVDLDYSSRPIDFDDLKTKIISLIRGKYDKA